MANSILEIIQNTIKQNLKNDNAVFVFPTDVAAFSWAEWTVKNTDCKAVARERFLAWDHFKSASALELSEGHPIPALLRKIFSENLMAENAASPIFKKIIAPEFAKKSGSFTDWISSLLPSLKNWHDRYVETFKTENPNDEEDEDYLLLYNRYRDFLENDPITKSPRKEKLYEPAWETRNLFTSGKDYFVFLPEVMDDYQDYKEFFTSGKNPDIHIINAKDSSDVEKKIEADYFSNTRTEIRKLCLELRALHEGVGKTNGEKNDDSKKSGVPWRDMAVSVTDIDSYLPYLERDLTLYAIPYIVRSGQKVTGINAGSIFTQVKDCHDNSFFYSTMRSLLTNSFLPWKEPSLNESLIREGQKRKCICNIDDVDIWEESLSAGNTGNTTERELIYYRKIKKWVNSLTMCKTFSDVRKAWFASRDELFAFDDEVENDCNLVLGHCMEKLDELIRLEKKYSCAVKEPYTFFVKELDNAIYQKQSKVAGVNIFKYKVSAAAAFPYQFLIDGSQNELTAMIPQMKFLKNEKRAKLGIIDEDNATDAFIMLYAKDKGKISCSQSTLSGFAIPHSRLTTSKDPDDTISAELLKYDFPTMENNFLKNEIGADGKSVQFPSAIYESEANGFLRYKHINLYATEKHGFEKSRDAKISDELKSKVQKYTTDDVSGKTKVDATNLKKYFPCRRSWLLSSILKLDSDSLAEEFFSNFDVGEIYHQVLHKFFEKYRKSKTPIPTLCDDGTLPNEEKILSELSCYVAEVLDESKKSKKLSFQKIDSKSPLIQEVMKTVSEKLPEFFLPALRAICAPYIPGDKNSGFGGFTVHALETEFKDSDKDFELHGQVDAIFLGDNGNYSILDYKTTKTFSPEDCIADVHSDDDLDEGNLPELKQFQMPVYMNLFQKSLHADERKDSGEIEQSLYFSLKNGTPTYIVKSPKTNKDGSKAANDKTQTSEEYQLTIRVMEKYAERYANEVSECKSFEPDFSIVNEIDDCKNCVFKNICRTTYSQR